MEGFIVRPPKFDPTKKYPVKFLMHGGPQTAWGDAWSYRWNLGVDGGERVCGGDGSIRRGSTGYGQKFVDEVMRRLGREAYVDLMKGLDYAEAALPVYRQDAGVCAGGELWRVHGGLGADAYEPVQVHRDA